VIDRLRRACAPPSTTTDERDPTAFWRELLEPSDYSNVIVDVIAGASAGGLNGVLYATSQHYGYDLDEVRDIWLKVGGLQSLIRRRDPRVSLLDADAGFLEVLQAELHTLITTVANPPATPPRVDMQLSATLVEPVARPAPSPDDEPLTDVRYLSRFHFANEPRAGWVPSDFPHHDRPDALIAATWRFALAGRSTSSFPVAFEPAFVRSSRPDTFLDDTVSATPGALVDMRGVFTDARGTTRSGGIDADDFLIADGGILDNIPLGKALSAIADATADRPTSRYLVYLHPTGPSDSSGEGTAPVTAPPVIVRRSLGTVVKGLKGSKISTESTLGDIAQMEAHNRAARRGAALRSAAFAFTSGHGSAGDAEEPGVVTAGSAALTRYQQERSLGDARAIEALLDDPIGALGGDPFPRRVAGPDGNESTIDDDRWRAPLAGWTASARQSLSGDLIREFARRIERVVGEAEGSPMGEVFTAGAGPIERVVRLMIGWARLLDERGATTPGGESAGELRQRLYDVLTFVQRNISAPRDLGWVAHAAIVGTDGSWGDIPLDAVDRLHRVDRATADALCGELNGPGATTEARQQHTRQLREVLHRICTTPESVPPLDLRNEIVDCVLVPIARELANAVVPDADDAGTSGPGGAPDPAALLHAALSSPAARQALASEHPSGRGVLAALDVLCYQEFLDGSPGSEISFVRMSASNPTPLAAAFETLRQADTDDEVEELSADRKLAGNEFKNFAAFVKDEWRANDWMWGRLDATVTLVELLVTPTCVQSLLGPGNDVPGALAAVERLVTSDSTSEEWSSWLRANVWSDREREIEAALRSFPAPAAGKEIPLAVEKIRAAVVARRQWEILAEELAKPARVGVSGADASLAPDETRRRAAAHGVGLETLTRPRSFAHARLFLNLSTAGGSTIAQNAHIFTNAATPDGKPTGLARTAGRAVKWGGRAATVAILVPRRAVYGLGGVLLAAIAAGIWWGAS
jgi:patatin-related protein